MKKLFLASIIGSALIVSSAQAHLEVGKYEGVDQSGKACGFEVTAVRFEGGVRHPLNERVDIKICEGFNMVLGHAPEIDRDKGEVGFDHHHLSGAVGIKGGADAAVIWMEHSPQFEGPRVFHFIHHDYKDASKNTHTECKDLKKAQ